MKGIYDKYKGPGVFEQELKSLTAKYGTSKTKDKVDSLLQKQEDERKRSASRGKKRVMLNIKNPEEPGYRLPRKKDLFKSSKNEQQSEQVSDWTEDHGQKSLSVVSGISKYTR